MKKNVQKQLLIVLIVAVVYYVLTLPQIVFTFPDGRSALRISGFVPIVAGLLFGPAGSIACGLGNLFSDAMGNLQITDFTGSFGVFIMGFLPYRLWHRLFVSHQNGPEYLTSVGSVLKYVFITVIATFSATSIGAIGGQLSHQYSFFGFFPQVALQYFDLSIVVGMFLFQLLSQYTPLRPCVPKNAYRTESNALCLLPDYLLCALVVVLALVVNTLTENVGASGSPLIQRLCIALLLCILLLAFLPTKRRGRALPAVQPFHPKGSLQRQLVTGFLALLCAVLLFYGGSMIVFFFLYFTGGSNVDMWTHVLVDVAIACVVLLLVLSVMMKWLEHHLTRPIRLVSSYAAHFVDENALTQQVLQLPKTNNEIDTLGFSLEGMVKSIRTYVEQIKEKTAAEERFAFEMSTAHNIQMSLLAKDWQAAAPFDLSAQTQPAQEVGGDFYDFRRFSNEKIFVTIADVSGKGISAALFMMRSNTLLSARNYATLAEAITRMNDKLSQQNDAMMFVTVFAGVLDCESKTFRYVNAGHNPALVYQNGSLDVLNTSPDFAVGPIEGVRYTEHCIPVASDFRLLLYTDGVTEAENVDGAFFGMARLLPLAEATLREENTSEEVIRCIASSVATFSKGTKQADDITMLCLSLGDAHMGK